MSDAPQLLQNLIVPIVGPHGEVPMHMDTSTFSAVTLDKHPNATQVDLAVSPHFIVDTIARPMIPPPTNPNPGNTWGPVVKEQRALSVLVVLVNSDGTHKAIWAPRRAVTNSVELQLGFRVDEPPVGLFGPDGQKLSDVRSAHFECSPTYLTKFTLGDGTGLVEAIRERSTNLYICGTVSEGGQSGGAEVWLKEYMSGDWEIQVRGT